MTCTFTRGDIHGRYDAIVDENRITKSVSLTESSYKIVSKGQLPSGKSVVVHAGESRPKNFFPNGYRGSHIIIPASYDSYQVQDGPKVPFELEEYIKGETLWNYVSDDDKVRGVLSQNLLEQIITAFWEFQTASAHLALEDMHVEEKIEKHFSHPDFHRNLPGELYREIEKLLASSAVNNFWRGQYVSKWGFSLGNLIMTPEGSIALTGFGKTGMRFLGYDLGWCIWPLWYHMERKHMEYQRYKPYLHGFCDMVVSKQPESFASTDDVIRALYLTVFERAIGAVYDLANNTAHLAANGIDDSPGGSVKKTLHRVFLVELLQDICPIIKTLI